MTTDEKLDALRAAVQRDVCGRGLARPGENLFTACAGDLAAACRSLAAHPAPVLGVVTGFYIPSVGRGETDGPLGAVYLARTLPALGVEVVLISDPFCRPALEAGLAEAGVAAPLFDLPQTGPPCTHLLALERVGPTHTPESIAPPDRDRFLAEVPPDRHGRCHTMRGTDITPHMRDAHSHFEGPRSAVTIGIGDGGNEIGMGKLPWRLVADHVPNGATIACRVATDHLIVAGISNWGAYALAAGVAALRGAAPPAAWFDPARERAILQRMVDEGPLVDGVSGQFTASVDGLPFEEYAGVLRHIADILRQ